MLIMLAYFPYAPILLLNRSGKPNRPRNGTKPTAARSSLAQRGAARAARDSKAHIRRTGNRPAHKTRSRAAPSPKPRSARARSQIGSLGKAMPREPWEIRPAAPELYRLG